jgi:Protein of unknown function (DUF3908)
MALTYEEFKQYVEQRWFDDNRSFLSILNDLSEFYDVENDFKYFYPRNVFNGKPTELIIFLNDGYLVVTKDNEQNYKYQEFNCKVSSKTLINTRYVNYNHELKIVFDNGNELIFNSLEDSSPNWSEEYARAIRELYKII